ncbi:MAG: DHH family phosphoesterase [Lachnospiraceae bacterium]|nr:DHH family phosphoesterase [Lachnospiraceae bacterium]
MKNQKLRLKGGLRFYMQWPLFLALLLAVVNVWIYFLDHSAGIIMSAFIAIYVIIASILYFYTRSNIITDMVKFSIRYNGVQNTLLKDLSVPYGVFLSDGRLVWRNDVFREVIDGSKGLKYIQKVFPDLQLAKFPTEEGQEVKTNITYQDRDYYVIMRKISVAGFSEAENLFHMPEEEEYFIAIHLKDVTELKLYIRKNEEQRLVAGLIYIDNYEDVMEDVEEGRQSLLLAIVDRKIAKYFSDVDGLLKKLEKDKYFFVVRHESYMKFEADNFSLLKDIKTITAGNTRPVTLSLGMGLNYETYAKSYASARIAIDLALARGGDQAVVKSIQGIKYFGGRNEQAARNTRVKARVKAEALREFIMSKDLVLIMGHKIMDADSFGASMGIYRSVTALAKKARIVFDESVTSIAPLYDEVCRSNAYPEDLFVTPVQSLDMIDDNTMVIVVDVNKPSLTECPELLEISKSIVVLDHHRKSSNSIENAVLSYIEPYSSSTCELVAEILQYIVEDIKIPVLEANCLYAGIMIDTRNFMNRTGVRTFEAAAFLRRCGADINRVRKMFRDDFAFYRAKAQAIQTAEVYFSEFAIAPCLGDIDNSTVLAAQTANELLDISGIKASFALTAFQGMIYMSARSIDEVNVQIIAEKMGGGGHINAAGAQLDHTDMSEAIQTLKDIIKTMVEDGDL